ncbi:hypothetical protein PACTADRAFT_49405 [Pachysolen tannophilus NRRL Y-2460]|uniref:EF-hand domain-containing protein n=1 Tax=Pachysolen tannophilus NRRL Y-2460 TaxID=669874 RepID=A0A1E4TW46_PACTA|nr:hypothetical protein PACTADRAFT_49405 [Pachysolen tannophilus NRRL Y-2460]
MSRETDEEREKRYHKLFDEIDVKKTGKICSNDFIDTFKKRNHPLQNSEIAIIEIFHAFDSNNENYIDYKRFKEYLIQAEEQILHGFNTLDLDNDGRLCKDDIRHYLKNYLNIEPSDAEINKFFNSLDYRKDGIITYDEFRDFLLFMPRLHGSRIRTAYQFFNDKLEFTNSEGDVTVLDDFLKGFGFFLAGGLSGVISRTATAPFDRVKVFLIARTDLTSTFLHSKLEIENNIELLKHQKITEPNKIKSPIIKAAKTLYRQGGIKAFYVGNGLNVLKVFPESAMKFGSFEIAKRFLCTVEGVDDPTHLSKISTYLSGGFGGVVSQFAVYPIDTLKYRVQCAQLDSNLRGTQLLIKTAKEMYSDHGIKIFYRGLLAGVTGIFPYAALDLGTFSTIKKWYFQKESKRTGIPEDDIKLPNHIVLSMGAVSGTFGASMVYPINLLRTRLQAQGTFAHPHRYNGFFDCARKTIMREGYSGLYKGLTPNLLKVAPSVSISYLCYENLKSLFHLE